MRARETDKILKGPWLVVALVYVTLLSGRTNISWLEDLPARFVLLIAAMIAYVAWKAVNKGDRAESHVSRFPVAVLLFFGYYIASGLWSATGARATETIANIALLLLCLFMLVGVARYDAESTRSAFLLCMYWSGIVFAAASAITGGTSGIGRSVAFGGGPNVFVRIVVWGTIAAIALAILRKRPGYLLALPILVLFTALSGSRGGITAAAVTSALLIFLLARRLKPAYIFAAVITIPGLLWFIWSNDQVQYILGRRFDWELIVESGYGSRQTLWVAAEELFRASPVIGNGLDAYYALAYIRTGFPYPHNIMLEIAVDLGVLGLTLFAIILIVICVHLLRNIKHLSVSQWAMFAGGLFTLIASMFSGDIFDSRFMWIFFALFIEGTAPGRRNGTNSSILRRSRGYDFNSTFRAAR
ncbi:MAG: O-antigen ligase family protein [Microbacterium gubbeenense]|uniref:O-antigen ligase family protein n=1 Tax=Microbacterium gubbeenense TaxID=159896 RepID=UPI003F9A3BB3